MLSIVMRRRQVRQMENYDAKKGIRRNSSTSPARKITPSKSVPNLYGREPSSDDDDGDADHNLLSPNAVALAKKYARRKSADMRSRENVNYYGRERESETAAKKYARRRSADLRSGDHQDYHDRESEAPHRRSERHKSDVGVSRRESNGRRRSGSKADREGGSNVSRRSSARAEGGERRHSKPSRERDRDSREVRRSTSRSHKKW